ncbi:Ubiquitin-protein ligase E3B [Rhizoclosmatium sp. JEL0117]|nr:Ubiquitin-protein ligase E3B [Rhizoclosmatium sp. JEL0117]
MFGAGPKKVSVAEEARRQREERERMRVEKEAVERTTKAGRVLVRQWEKRIQRRKAFEESRKEFVELVESGASGASGSDGNLFVALLVFRALQVEVEVEVEVEVDPGNHFEALARRIANPGSLAQLHTRATSHPLLFQRAIETIVKVAVLRAAASPTSTPELRLLVAIATCSSAPIHEAATSVWSLKEWSAVASALSANVAIAVSARRRLDANAEKPALLGINAWLLVTMSLFAQKGSTENHWPHITAYLLSTPLLLSVIDESGKNLLKKHNALKSTLALLSTTPDSSPSLARIHGELSLYLLANLLELVKLDPSISFASDSRPSTTSSQTQSPLMPFVGVATNLLLLCAQYVKSKATNKSRFHPVLQWYSGPVLDIPTEFHTRLADTLSFLWSRPFLNTLFADLLSFGFPPPQSSSALKKTQFFNKLGFRDDGISTVDATTISVSTLEKCQLYYQLTRVLKNSATHILTALSWTPGLIPRLWRLIGIVGPPHSLGTQLFLKAATNPAKEPLIPIFHLFCECCCILFLTLDDDDLYTNQFPFLLDELAALSAFLNAFCFTAIWTSPTLTSPTSPSTLTLEDGLTTSLHEASHRLLSILYDQSTRRPFTDTQDPWTRKEVSRASIVDDIKRNDPRALQILTSMPQTIPFPHRVDIFRHLVRADKATIGETPLVITVRRTTLLEDGFRQLSKITPAQLKQTVKVRFVSALGVPEAGIDQHGLFKEFLEDISKRAFASDFGLFRTTDDGNVVPSVGSGVHENHLELLEFVGRMFSKALYEGIVIDVPFAPFVYAKMVGRINYLEDLPSLDAQLYKNLCFLKHYEGDVEDLGLSFTIDEDLFGHVRTKEIKPGGAAIVEL